MDPLALATMAVGLMTPYFLKAGEALAEKAGAAAWEKVKAIYAAVNNKLRGDSYSEETLARLAAEPQSKNRQAALAGILEEKIKDDPSFAASLQKLLEEAQASGADKITQHVTVSDRARTGDITQIGKVEGSIDLHKKR
jgi:hypothetical protein